MRVKQTARIISTYAADVSGVCSALFELGGMTVMHDASGCNSTYNTHDEPRWYDFDSMVFLSGLSEMEAIMGDDRKLIEDIVSAAGQLNPKFIAIAGTPIPMMIGTDFEAIASVVEKRTGIPAFGFKTNGMHTYIAGASNALEAVAKRLVTESLPKTNELSVNILGATPLDFSVNKSVSNIKKSLEERKIETVSCWAMGDFLEGLQKASSARVNLVVSYSGMAAAKALQGKFGTPYVVGKPSGKLFADKLASDIKKADETGGSFVSFTDRENDSPKIVVMGESVLCGSLAYALWLETGQQAMVISAVETEEALLCGNDRIARDEDEIIPLLHKAEVIIADPLYKPICPKNAKFIPLGHEGFSGRIFREEIDDLVHDINYIKKEVVKK